MFRKRHLNREEFINFLLEKMHLETQYAPPSYNEEAFTINWDGCELFIGNIYEDYLLLSPKEAAESLDHTFKKIKTLLKSENEELPSFEEAIPSLLPVIRSRAYVENLQQAEKIPYKLLNEHIAVVISIDTEASIAIPKDPWFEKNGVDFDIAFNYAIQNLEAINEGGFEEIFPGVWRSSWKDGYDPSRILCGIYTMKQLDINGDPVIFIPHREVLIITGSENMKGIEQSFDFCEEYHGLNRSITSLPFSMHEREDESYSLDVFEVSEDHPLYEKISSLTQL
ncbi:MAG: DUF1444 family protein [Alphaproteobacteria bacterium]|nr:DUF1444 family protein [Alphaproteobacteria bacterium]